MKRILYPISSLSSLSFPLFNSYCDEVKNKKKITVFGSGFAGRSFVENISKDKFDVSLISPQVNMNKTTTFVCQPRFTDSLQTCTSMHLSQWTVPSKVKLLNSTLCNLVPSNIMTDINLANRVNLVKLYREQSADIVVLAVGSETNTFGIEGILEHCYMYKNVNDFEKIKEKLKSINKDSKIAILGGGILGVELSSFFSTICNTTMFEMDKQILPMKEFDVHRNKIEQHLKNQTIDIKTNHKVKKIYKLNDKTIVEYLIDDKINQADYDIVIYTCGVKPNTIMSNLLFNKVNDKLQFVDKNNKTHEDVYVIGDCNKLIPQSAQNAKQQGLYLANFLNGKSDESYLFKNRGTMIRLSDRVYIVSDYYNGFAPMFIHNFTTWLNA